MNELLEDELSDIDLEINPISNIDKSFDDLIEDNHYESNIKNFFEIANENVKAATEIFNKSVAMKNKLLQQAETIKKQREEHEKKTKLEKERKTK